MVKAILFDFWGTLVENGIFPSPVRQAKYILRLQKVPFPDYITRFEKSFMTQKFDSLTEAFQNVIDEFELNPPSFVNEKLVGMWNKNMLLCKPFADTLSNLEKLKKKYKIVLISNTDQFTIKQVIDKFGLKDYFDEMIFSHDLGILKNDSEMFETALKKVGVKPEDAVMVGDSMESDIRGAEKAGIKAILIDRRDKREYNHKIVTLNDLQKMITKIEKGE